MGEIVFDVFNYIVLALMLIVFIYPLWYCFVTSISMPSKITSHSGPLLLPLGFSLESYKVVFANKTIVRGIFNTIFYVTAGTALNILMTSLGAYVLSRKRYYWRRFFTFVVVFTMYFGGGLIPFYILVKNVLHLDETPFALIIPVAINTFYLLLMRTYFQSIPDSMEESALIDGANDFVILSRIYFPLAMPIVAVLIVYYGVGHWNSWFYAMIFLMKSKEWHPLQLILRTIMVQYSAIGMAKVTLGSVDREQTARLIKFSLIIITIAPIVLIYPYMQKFFIKGVMIGSLKG